VRARNGFVPTNVAQSPPPGSIARFNSVTKVTLTAHDGENRSLSCNTNVRAPPLSVCGSVEMNITRDTVNRLGVFVRSDRYVTITGTAFKMKGKLQNELAGRGSVTGRLRKGGEKYAGSITFKGNQTKGALNNFMIDEPFTLMNASDALQINMTVQDNENPEVNVAKYVVYCQETFGYQVTSLS
jgi:hypothetical protein